MSFAHATWIDATGARTRVLAHFASGEIALRVPASVVDGARYPVVLDPVVGPEILIDVPVAGSVFQRAPAIASNGSDRFLVVWEERRGTDYAIYGVRVSVMGALLDAAPILLSPGGIEEQAPSVAWNGTSFQVVWSDQREPRGIWGTRVDAANGALLDPAGAALFLPAGGAWAAYEPAIAADGPGAFLVWEDWRGGGKQIFGSRVTVDGTALDPAGIRISPAAPLEFQNAKRAPSLASGGGSYLACWRDEDLAVRSFVAARVAPTGVVQDPSGIDLAFGDDVTHRCEAAFGGDSFLVLLSGPSSIGIQHVVVSTGASTAFVRIPGSNGLPTPQPSAYQGTIVFDGARFFVAYPGNEPSPPLVVDVRGTALALDGSDIDATDLFVTSGGGIAADALPALSAVSGSTLVAYTRNDGSTPQRLALRMLSAAPQVPAFPF